MKLNMLIICCITAGAIIAQSPPHNDYQANPPAGCNLAAIFTDGPSARDWSYRALQPIIFGGTNWSSSGYFSFGGDNSYIDYGGSNFNSSAHVTYACWFRRTNAWSLSAIIGGGEYINGDGCRPYLARWDGDRVQFGWHASEYGYKHASLSYELDVDRWYHAVGTFDGATIKLYINGDLEASTSPGVPIPIAAEVDVELLIGAQKWGIYGYNFTGDISDVLIYDRALSAAEIADLYQRGKSEGK